MKAFLLATASVALMAGGALAQNYSAPPTYGSVNLNAGFTPDPYNVNITSGGSIAASNVSSECRGWVANAPDYSVNYAAGGYDLTIGATSNSDTTLLVNGPNGEWYCDDDGGQGLNPLIHLNNPNSGRYDVWIGSYSQGDFAATTLSVSEIGVTQGNAGTPNYAATPTFGSVNLNSGFTPDPYLVNVTSGGARSAAAISSSCRGWIADAPDFSVNYNAGGYNTLTIGAVSGSDTTLVVNDAFGNWYCDDDGGDGVNPLVTLTNLASGRYDIWVGSYSQGNNAASVLSISEVGLTASNSGTPNTYAQPTFGSANLNAGFTPDPYVVTVNSGGARRASDISSSCRGWIADAPDFSVNYNAGGYSTLTIGAVSNSDTTLVINDAYGNWYCDDDGGNGLNPLVTLTNLASGRYDIWVGSYSQGDYATSQLSISEIGQVAGQQPPVYVPPQQSGINMSAPAAYGTVSLRAGFQPDPYRVSITSGGGYRADSVRSGCAGWVASAPDFELTYSAGSLPLIISAASNSDTTLLINDPNGNWFCDDDGGNAGLNPSLRFNNAASGVYDIWIGSYSQGNNATASLSISELYSE